MAKLPIEIKDYNLTKVARFLLNTIGISNTYLDRFKVKNAYLSKEDMSQKLIHVEFTYIEEEFDITVYNALLEFYTFNRYYIKEGSLIFVFGINPNWEEVYNLFLEGKYYEMGQVTYQDTHRVDALIPASSLFSIPEQGSTYLENYFFKHIPTKINGKTVWLLSNNYKIMTKDEKYKKKVEEYLDTKLPENAELFSKIDESDFID